jgi:hypothetical protein
VIKTRHASQVAKKKQRV